MNGCLSMDAITRPDALSADERTHLASCPRCAARVDQYADFVAGRTSVPPADLADAEARLGGFLDQELGVGSGGGARSAGTVRPRLKPSAWQRFREWCSAPVGRAALGFAALAILAGGVIVLRPAVRPSAVERGGTAESLVPTVRADDAAHAVRLEWHARSGADQYTVEILAEDLTPLATFGPMTTTSFTLARAAVTSRPPGATVYVRVEARHAGLPLESSAPEPLRLP